MTPCLSVPKCVKTGRSLDLRHDTLAICEKCVKTGMSLKIIDMTPLLSVPKYVKTGRSLDHTKENSF